MVLPAVLAQQRRRDHRQRQLLPVQLRGAEAYGRGRRGRGDLRDVPRRRRRDAVLRCPRLHETQGILNTRMAAVRHGLPGRLSDARCSQSRHVAREI